MSVNGTYTSQATTDLTFTAGRVTQLAASNAANELEGDLCEFIKWNRVLTTTERQQVESYLKTKWRTP